MHVEARIEEWPLREPIRITGHEFHSSKVVHVRVTAGGFTGHGEGSGVYYRGDDAAHIIQAIEAVRAELARGVSREELQSLLPPGGARNALDCALWDLEAKRSRKPVWVLAGLESPHALVTTFTIGAGIPEVMARVARSFPEARALKLKLLGDGQDAARVQAVREVHPNAWMGVDANQGYTLVSLQEILPELVAARVQLVEQPLPVGSERDLEGLRPPIPIAADESAQGIADLEALLGRFDVVNIKLDKCGGLTEGLEMARRARELGLDVMVGNMTGTSLSMAPAYLIGQLCSIVDLDGPVFLREDRSPGVDYSKGLIRCPESVWGGS